MQLTKYAHACVRLQGADGALVIDPGEWAEPAALADVGSVLVTHEHFDHVDAAKIKAAQTADSSLAVFGVAPVVDALHEAGITAEVIAAGDSITASGFAVDVVGGEHAEIWCGKPGCPNLGFIVDRSLYHPGDAFLVPEQPIETLLLPVSGPWLKTGEVIDFARTVNATRLVPMHDALLSEIGLQVTDRWVQTTVETEYIRLALGASLEI